MTDERDAIERAARLLARGIGAMTKDRNLTERADRLLAGGIEGWG